jgi:hypothetical protein
MSRSPEKRPAFESPVRLVEPGRRDPDMKRPGSTVAGATLVLLRVFAGVVWMVSVAFGWQGIVVQLDLEIAGGTAGQIPEGVSQLALGVVLVVVAVPLVVDAVLAFLILRGWNWPRVIVMFVSVVSICTAFVTWWVQGQDLHLDSALLPLAFDILVLLALSSRSASAYARRNERREDPAQG